MTLFVCFNEPVAPQIYTCWYKRLCVSVYPKFGIMPAHVATKPPALKRPMHFSKRPEAQFAKKPVAPMRVVPVGTKPEANKRGQHVMERPEITASEAATNAFFMHNFVSLAGPVV